MSICILVIADTLTDVETVHSLLVQHPEFAYELHGAVTAAQAVIMASSLQIDVILLVSTLRDEAVLATFLHLKSNLKSIPIVVAAEMDENALFIVAVRKFAHRYFNKTSLQANKLIPALESARHRQNSTPVPQDNVPQDNATQDNVPQDTDTQDNQIQFRSFFENTNDAVLICSVDAVIRKTNRRCSELFGYAAEEMIGRKLMDFITPRERSAAQYNALRMLAGTSLPVFERTFVSSNGKEVPTEVNSALVVDAQGNPLHYQVFIRDIRLRKEAEASLQAERALLSQRVQERTAELQAANEDLNRVARAKDQFLAIVSHELRTPLAAVLNLSEAIQEGIYGPLNSRQNEMMGKIEQSGRHLLSLLNDILDISRIETRGLELDWDDVLIEEVCRNSFFLVQETARSREIQMVSSNFAPMGKLVADERRLTQILVNLLGNAIKFTPKGGKVGLEVREATQPCLSSNQQNGDNERMLDFVIWDTGIGIASEDIPKLFQPFVQLHHRHSNQMIGSGLGLALVERLVKLHGGTISVESTPNVGSKFIVTLPWHTSRPAYHLSNADETTTLWEVV